MANEGLSIVAGFGILSVLVSFFNFEETSSKYVYDGKIGEDEVIFSADKNYLHDNNHLLTVNKPDGRIISYMDFRGNDLILDEVVISEGEKRRVYGEDNMVGREVLEKAQEQFDNYLARIIKINTNQGLDNLD